MADLPRPTKRPGSGADPKRGQSLRGAAPVLPTAENGTRRDLNGDTTEFRAPRPSYDPYTGEPLDPQTPGRSNDPEYPTFDDYNHRGERPRKERRPSGDGYRQERRPSGDGYRQERPAPRPRRGDDYIEERPVRRKKTRRRHHRSLLWRILRPFVVLAVVIFVLYSAAAIFMIKKLDKAERMPRTYTSGTLDAPYVRSILLIGTDTRDLSTDRGRSDSMILLTLNSRTKTIGLTSFMRDAYVSIPGHGEAKLNAAYSYGGAELLMDTLEANYNVSIDDYCCVTFAGFAGVIDAFGGVDITLTDAEAEQINIILQSEVNEMMGDDKLADLLPGGGTYTLTGKQALSYARIRHVGNADFDRTSRQREVMQLLLEGAKSRFASAVPKLADAALPHVATNMDDVSLYLLSLRAPFLLGYDISQMQIPADGTWSYGDRGGQSVLIVDFAADQQILRDTVYASTAPEDGQ